MAFSNEGSWRTVAKDSEKQRRQRRTARSNESNDGSERQQAVAMRHEQLHGWQVAKDGKQRQRVANGGER